MGTNSGQYVLLNMDKQADDGGNTSPDNYSLSELEGEIGGTGADGTGPADNGTLDEPVYDTLMRDLKAVANKFYHVLYPKKSQTLLRDWDLWGPLFLCVFISLVMTDFGAISSKGPQFTEVFVISWFGACVVTLNIKLLGGTISFFQSLCVLGYCLLAPAIALVICKVILLVSSEQTVILFSIRLLVTIFGFSWATFASTAFFANTQPPNKKALAVYPIFLFYFVLSWMIVSNTH